MQVKALQSRVSPDTESEFDDAFWSGLDLVVNALDNVSSHRYFPAVTNAAVCTVWHGIACMWCCWTWILKLWTV